MADVMAPLFGADGNKKGEIPLDADVFGINPNQPVMHQVVVAQLAGARSGTASTKTRAEVRGGGRKPWRQKGLGRARQGSIRAPHWAGGGVAHGPKPRDYSQRTPKKMKRLALRSALSTRASEKAVIAVDDLPWEAPKTKQALSLLSAIGAQGKTLVVVPSRTVPVERSFRNLDHVVLAEPQHVTTYDVLWADDVVLVGDSVGSVGRSGKQFAVADDDFVKESVVDSPADTDGGEEE